MGFPCPLIAIAPLFSALGREIRMSQWKGPDKWLYSIPEAAAFFFIFFRKE
jgi:hypothetical protein